MRSDVLVHRHILTAVAAVAVTGAVLSVPATAAVPLMKDFIGLNGHSYGFVGTTYAPVASLVRDYHPMSWDVGSNTSTTTQFPLGNAGWPNWNTDEYGKWVAAGFRVDLDVQFDPISPTTGWSNMAADALKYGQEVGAYFGSVKTGGTGGTKLANSIEIGNEPSSYSATQYATVFKNMAQGVRNADPNMLIVTCNVTANATSGGYDEPVSLFKTNNLTSLVDVYAIHTYAFKNAYPTWERTYPEYVASSFTYLTDVQNLINWRNTNDPTAQVWVTEFGYDATTAPNYTTGTFSQEVFCTDKQQAQWLVRSYLAFAKMGVDRAYMYYFDDANDPSLHASSGLTRTVGGVQTKKASFYAIAHMQKTLANYKFTSAVTHTTGQYFVDAYTNGTNANDLIWVIWSPTSGRADTLTTIPVVLPGTAGAAELMPLTAGAASAVSYTLVSVTGGYQVRLAVSESPTYLHILVPEPASLGLLGLSGLPWMLRRRRRLA